MTTPGAVESIAQLSRVLPSHALLGVGTIREPDQLRAAAHAGAQFAVTPHLRLDLVATAVELGLPIIPGALTASEVVAAWEAGAAAVKIFPASSVGGPSYLKALGGPLPEIPLMPSGGIGVDDVGAYLKAGAVTVGLGGPLMGDAVDGGDLGALAERARRAAAASMTGSATQGRSGLVTLGETMAMFDPPTPGLLRQATSLRVSFGGAESNVAIGVARLGLPAAWCGRVGADPFGDLIVTALRGEGVDVSGVIRDPEKPTSLMFKERRTPGSIRVLYYRAGGPGSRLTPDDLDPARLQSAQVLHLTGITPALSASAAATVRSAAARAREAGALVSLDLNYRSALWSPEQAAAEYADLIALSDLVFASDDEAEIVGLTGTPAELAAGLASMGPATAVIKLGARGAVAFADGQHYEVAAVPVTAVDAVGAGDAFVAGYLTELMLDAPVESRLETAARCGAFAVTVSGDWEALPNRAELALLSNDPGTVSR